MTNHDQWFPAEPKNAEWPEVFTAKWYRLRALQTMTKEQMESMLAFLSGYTETGWDMAYEQSGAAPIELDPDDPDYDDSEMALQEIADDIGETLESVKDIIGEVRNGR